VSDISCSAVNANNQLCEGAEVLPIAVLISIHLANITFFEGWLSNWMCFSKGKTNDEHFSP
jgi:hypothetical protein